MFCLAKRDLASPDRQLC